MTSPTQATLRVAAWAVIALAFLLILVSMGFCMVSVAVTRARHLGLARIVEHTTSFAHFADVVWARLQVLCL